MLKKFQQQNSKQTSEFTYSWTKVAAMYQSYTTNFACNPFRFVGACSYMTWRCEATLENSHTHMINSPVETGQQAHTRIYKPFVKWVANDETMGISEWISILASDFIRSQEANGRRIAHRNPEYVNNCSMDRTTWRWFVWGARDPIKVLLKATRNHFAVTAMWSGSFIYFTRSETVCEICNTSILWISRARS